MKTGTLETRGELPTFSMTRKNITNQSGTWSRHISPKKNHLQESSVLKENPLSLVMDSILTGTDLMSDLNTPDIKFEDFDFHSGNPTSSYNRGNVNVESSRDAMEPSVGVVCNQDDDSLLVEAPTTGVAYTLFDMSPGSRGLLEALSPSTQEDLHADQQEQRINLEEYQESASTLNVRSDVITYNDGIFTNPIPELDHCMQETLIPVEDCPQPAQMEMLVTHNNPPQLSISEGDLEFSIPQNLLEQMESLFPEEQAIESSLIQSSNVCTTELDMFLGQQDFNSDLLSESLEQSGLLDDELSSFVCEDTCNDDFSNIHINSLMPNSDAVQSSIAPQVVQPNTLDLEPVGLPAEVAERSTFLLTKDFLSTPVTIHPAVSATFNNENDFKTTFIVNASSTGAVPKTPVKKRQHQEDTTPVINPVKRQRRASRKPLRFRELYTDEDFTDSGSSESFADQESRLWTDPSDIDIKNVNVDVASSSNVSARRRSRGSVEELTEEQKYHRIRQLNNEASKRCRLKRKLTVKQMEAQMEELVKRNLVLREKHEALKQLKDKFQGFVSDYFKTRLMEKSTNK
ncbi:uncharacterized protein LOC135200227 [Macrobrachium nipponense]|uniref:uncharacterized protein LOC135200227 n=1 Tax=Macrobrachium nipponense TaxID=159736 RepID=UPI0030C81B96